VAAGAPAGLSGGFDELVVMSENLTTILGSDIVIGVLQRMCGFASVYLSSQQHWILQGPALEK
jgi:hypothetical protein